MSVFARLGDDLPLVIFSFLDTTERVLISAVSKHWSVLVPRSIEQLTHPSLDSAVWPPELPNRRLSLHPTAFSSLLSRCSQLKCLHIALSHSLGAQCFACPLPSSVNALTIAVGNQPTSAKTCSELDRAIQSSGFLRDSRLKSLRLSGLTIATLTQQTPLTRLDTLCVASARLYNGSDLSSPLFSSLSTLSLIDCPSLANSAFEHLRLPHLRTFELTSRSPVRPDTFIEFLAQSPKIESVTYICASFAMRDPPDRSLSEQQWNMELSFDHLQALGRSAPLLSSLTCSVTADTVSALPEVVEAFPRLEVLRAACSYLDFPVEWADTEELPDPLKRIDFERLDLYDDKFGCLFHVEIEYN